MERETESLALTPRGQCICSCSPATRRDKLDVPSCGSRGKCQGCWWTGCGAMEQQTARNKAHPSPGQSCRGLLQDEERGSGQLGYTGQCLGHPPGSVITPGRT